MHTWNAAAFGRLEEIADAKDLPLKWRGYQEYCRYRAMGLRKKAMAAVQEFAVEARHWSNAEVREFCNWALNCYHRASNPAWLIPHPLMTALIQPVLLEWRQEEPMAFVPAKWLGILNRDWDLLKEATTLEGADGVAQQVLAEFALGDLDFMLHHLGEGLLLGTPGEADAAVKLARVEVAAVQDAGARRRMAKELEENAAMLEDYREFKAIPEDQRTDFPTWCTAKGRNYEFLNAYYYEE